MAESSSERRLGWGVVMPDTGRPDVVINLGKEQPELADVQPRSFDDSPAPVRATNSGGQRNITPVRVRPHSQPRDRPTVEPVAAPLRIRARHLSRRKERRWANARLAGGGGVQFNEALAGELDMEDLENLVGKMQIEYRSGFEGLLRADDEESVAMRNEFVSCKGSFAGATATQQARSLPIRLPTGQLTSAEDRFQRIERKLRHQLVTTGTRPQFTHFVSVLEQVLMAAFEMRGNMKYTGISSASNDTETEIETANAAEVLGISLNELKFALDLKDASKVKVNNVTNGSQSLALCFRSGVYRVLAHGVCEFHGLRSSSADVTSRRRVTTIVHPGAPKAQVSRKDAVTGKQVVSPSLARFLVDHHSRAVDILR